MPETDKRTCGMSVYILSDSEQIKTPGLGTMGVFAGGSLSMDEISELSYEISQKVKEAAKNCNNSLIIGVTTSSFYNKRMNQYNSFGCFKRLESSESAVNFETRPGLTNADYRLLELNEM